MEIRKILTEEQILSRIKRDDWGLPPLTVERVEVLGGSKDTGIDALITLRWQGKNYRFGAEVRRLWTPKAVIEGVRPANRVAV